MKLRGVFFGGLAISLLVTACVHKAAQANAVPSIASTSASAPAPTPAPIVATKPVFVPDYSHSGQPLPANILVWDGISKTVDVSDDVDFANFTFNFTNISSSDVIILGVHPSCHCTMAELPPVPWTIPAGSNDMLKAKVDLNIAGRSGTLFKRVTVVTDKGTEELLLRVNIIPSPIRTPGEADRQRQMQMAKMNRQAVFHADCADCHVRHVEGKYGQQLYDAVCSICHNAENRATIVPDLSRIKAPTNQEFWRTWISYGKPGTLMPAFSTTQGGPLTDMQIASLAAYLNSIHPSHVPVPQ